MLHCAIISSTGPLPGGLGRENMTRMTHGSKVQRGNFNRLASVEVPKK